jgi:hypothetical protein
VNHQASAAQYMIHRELATGAAVLNHTLEVAPHSLPQLVPLFGVGLLLLQRELLLHLWSMED